MSIRQYVGPSGRKVVRSTALLVGRRTSWARMLPSFLVIGAQRSGTTTLYRLLVDHPSVVRPAFHKGIGYFDINYLKGPNWYRGHFPMESVARIRTRENGSPVTFDSSGYYLYHPLAAGRIARDLPEVRVVALVRDPVERAFSAHAHEFARGFEKEAFARAIEMEPDRIRGEAQRIIAEPGYNSYSHRHYSYLARGRYAEQLEVYARLLGPERVKAIDADAFFAEPVASFVELQQWLGLPVTRPTHVGVHNARPRGDMDTGLRAELTQYFEPWDEQLVAYLGHEPSWRQ